MVIWAVLKQKKIYRLYTVIFLNVFLSIARYIISVHAVIWKHVHALCCENNVLLFQNLSWN